MCADKIPDKEDCDLALSCLFVDEIDKLDKSNKNHKYDFTLCLVNYKFKDSNALVKWMCCIRNNLSI